jgi:hypothetical protein
MDFQNKEYNKDGSPVSESRDNTSGKKTLPPLEKPKAPSSAGDRVPIDGLKKDVLSNEAIQNSYNNNNNMSIQDGSNNNNTFENTDPYM